MTATRGAAVTVREDACHVQTAQGAIHFVLSELVLPSTPCGCPTSDPPETRCISRSRGESLEKMKAEHDRALAACPPNAGCSRSRAIRYIYCPDR